MSKKKKPGAQAPYRGGPDRKADAPPEDTGLVGDLIRQFADPLAFYRELVQNALDAGTTRIAVQLSWEADPDDDARGTMRVAVTDDGTGMSRATLEEDLTVLFRSTKESRDDAIGKFGIGFVSVLAISPEVVIVDTSTGDGVRWSLHLHPDQSYDLYRAESGGGRGTTVSLHVPMPAADRASFVERSEKALVRWCGHARVPIQLVAVEPGLGTPVREARIDRPIGIDALVSVQARSRDGATVVVAGLPESGGRCGAFYNQGLLLHETRDHELGEVVFKVMDPRLEHTLSRDDVRRDAHYERVIELVGRTIRGPLLDAIGESIAQHALAWARGGDQGGRALLGIVEALGRASLPIAPGAVRLPIVAAPGGAETGPAPDGGAALYTLDRATPLARALAAAGHTVYDLGFARTAEERESVLTWVVSLAGTAPREDRRIHTLIAPIEADRTDRDLLASVADHLHAVARRPSEIVLASVHGRGERRLALAGGSRREPWVVATEIDADPLRLLSRPPLVLHAAHAVVRAARARARTEPVLASILLARAVLVSLAALDDARAAELTERGIRAALGGTA